ncbi:SusC/RagA family TonB-linked outer membrane protein [Niabella sp. CC-SYL272]|uniref:SusC/RagA family TonB-linked outer membrane protein n=1 Tax=Niabella agricola TaxID=2891571 RepID=UPI001F198EA0|nr:SusC/RagA family TonB-linked outer membrane protein [Niabella agricola]MCF3109567.1 SusC/RagA family TonB-linked outer membrane protein [Niabella agricola]
MKYFLLLGGLIASFTGYAQTLTGTVQDEERQPLPAVTITVKHNGMQTLTDEFGRFTVDDADSGTVLIVTAVAMEEQEIASGGSKDVTITLHRKASALDEVQVVAYGTNTQRYNLGSVTKIKAEDIEKQAVSNPLTALQGRSPGLVINATSGVPGGGYTVQVRGQNTITTNLGAVQGIDNPLFIVDGVPFAPQNANINQFSSVIAPGAGRDVANPYGGLSPFASIAPADIESIEILRDADATAIYGSKGGNGVILITTKKGKEGKTTLDVSVRTGISFVPKGMPMASTQQYLAARREAFKNDGLTPSVDPAAKAYAPDLLIFDSKRNINWKDRFSQAAWNTNVNTSLSGGNKNTQFRFGASYSNNQFTFPGDFLDQHLGALLGLHHNTNDRKFSFDLSANYSYGSNNTSSATDLLLTATLPPNFPEPVNPDGSLLWRYKGVSLDGGGTAFNPYAYLKRKYETKSNMLNSNVLLSYQPVTGLYLKSSFGISTLGSNEYSAYPLASQNPDDAPIATAQFGTNSYTTWIIEPQAEYKRGFGRLSGSIMLGSTFQQNQHKSTEMYGSGFVSDELIKSISGAAEKSASDQFSEYRYAALFGRLKLNYSDKYLLSLNFRRDGSSRFGPGKQFGNFGSVGAGWLFREEQFVKDNLSFLSYGKIRASYGVAGSDAIGDYNFLSRWQPSQYSYNGESGYYPLNLYNPGFSWASTKKLEIGLELGFAGDRVLFTAAWYRNRSGNQLVNYSLPAITGFSTVLQNWNALVENTGLELMLQGTVIKREKFSWNASFNITLPKNKLLSFPGLEESAYATTYQEGMPLGALYKYRYAGVDPATGLFQFYKKDGTLTSKPEDAGNGDFNDRSYIGSRDPKFYGGLMNSITYGRLQLDIFLEFRKQMGINYLGQAYTRAPGQKFNFPAALLDRWQKEGDAAAFQKYSSSAGSEAGRTARYFVESDAVYSDASFLKVRTIALSYDLPVTKIRKPKMSTLRLFITAQNLFTITGYKGNDPETQSFYGVPPLKSFTGGLQLKF